MTEREIQLLGFQKEEMKEHEEDESYYYALDIVDMSAMLMQTNNLKDKYALMDALDTAQRKKDWHYRQANFRLQDAMRIFEAAKAIAKK